MSFKFASKIIKLPLKNRMMCYLNKALFILCFYC